MCGYVDKYELMISMSHRQSKVRKVEIRSPSQNQEETRGEIDWD